MSQGPTRLQIFGKLQETFQREAVTADRTLLEELEGKLEQLCVLCIVEHFPLACHLRTADLLSHSFSRAGT